MTGAELIPVVSFIVFLIVTFFGFWKYLDGKLEDERKETSTTVSAAHALASLTRQELAEHRLHVAESYVSKAGHREMTEAVMDAIGAVRQSVDGLSMRIDRMNDSKPATTRRA
jgi:hypothetical protein